MNAIEDLKERLIGQGQQLKGQIQESPLYNQLKDRYENLTPVQQKITQAILAILTLFIVFYYPISEHGVSQSTVREFESLRQTMRELLIVHKESSEVPQIPVAPAPSQIKAVVEGHIKSAELLPEQIRSIVETEVDSRLIPRSLSQGALQIQLSKLNLRQIVNLASQFHGINPSVKMRELSVEANREDARYFDLLVTLVSLKVPSIHGNDLNDLPNPVRQNRGSRNQDPPQEEN